MNTVDEVRRVLTCDSEVWTHIPHTINFWNSVWFGLFVRDMNDSIMRITERNLFLSLFFLLLTHEQKSIGDVYLSVYFIETHKICSLLLERQTSPPHFAVCLHEKRTKIVWNVFPPSFYFAEQNRWTNKFDCLSIQSVENCSILLSLAGRRNILDTQATEKFRTALKRNKRSNDLRKASAAPHGRTQTELV